MSTKFRTYKNATDYKLVGDFLSKNYITDNKDGNWVKPAWEFIHNHPCIEMFQLDKIGIWEDNEKIVGIVHLENPFGGSVSFGIDPMYKFLKSEMLKYAENAIILRFYYISPLIYLQGFTFSLL